MIINRFRSLLIALEPVRRKLPSFAIGGAWLFALGSLIPLLMLIFSGGAGEEDTTARLVSAQSNGQVHSALGLAYAGISGAFLIGFELLVILAATAITGLPDRWRPIRSWSGWPNLHRIGHAVLIGWAALWTLGFMRLAVIEPGLLTVRAIFMAMLMGCTLYRALRQWPRMISNSPPPQTHLDLDSSPNTDVAFESRLILHRSAVRPSATLREINRAADL